MEKISAVVQNNLLRVMIILFSSVLQSSQLKEELKKLSELKEKLRQVRVARLNDKIDSYNRLKSLEMKVYSLEDSLSELRSRKFSLEEELNSIKLETEKIQEEYDEFVAKKKEIENFLIEKCAELRQRIESSFPYKKHDRLRKLNSVKTLSQLFDLLEEELILGRSCELYFEEIDEENVKVLKIGGIFSAYISADGEIGLLEKRIRKDKIVHLWNKNISLGLKKKLQNIFQTIKKQTVIKIPIDVMQGAKKEKVVAKKGLWGWFIKGGPVMIPIALVGLAIIVMTIEKLIAFKREHTNADVLMNKVMELWNNGQKEEAIRLCETTRGPVARMLRTGLENHLKGKEVVEEMLHEQRLEELPKLERHLSTIAVLGGIAPLLGLLGTVSGMINTFHVVTYYGGGDPRVLAGGISEALITTKFGLIIAIPTLLLHNYLSNKADRIATDMEKSVVKLTNSLKS